MSYPRLALTALSTWPGGSSWCGGMYTKPKWPKEDRSASFGSLLGWCYMFYPSSRSRHRQTPRETREATRAATMASLFISSTLALVVCCEPASRSARQSAHIPPFPRPLPFVPRPGSPRHPHPFGISRTPGSLCFRKAPCTARCRPLPRCSRCRDLATQRPRFRPKHQGGGGGPFTRREPPAAAAAHASDC